MASIADQLKRIIVKKVKIKNGKTLEQMLMEAVDYLYICIQSEIDSMYEEYIPKVYERRSYFDSLRSSLYVEDFIDARIKGNTIELSLKFSSNVWAWNFNHTHKSNVAVLMNEGWQWDNWIENDVWRFTHYEGYHFIQNGIAKFNKHNHWGVKIRWNIDSSDWY